MSQGKSGKIVRTTRSFAGSKHWKTSSLHELFRISKQNRSFEVCTNNVLNWNEC